MNQPHQTSGLGSQKRSLGFSLLSCNVFGRSLHKDLRLQLHVADFVDPVAIAEGRRDREHGRNRGQALGVLWKKVCLVLDPENRSKVSF